MKKVDRDVVWYWSGGREEGEWRSALPKGKSREDIDNLVREINRGGRVAIAGRLVIGAPEGPPAEHMFKDVGV